MYTLTPKKNSNKSSKSTLQTTFNRHRRKIDQLRNQIERLQKENEEALILYHSDVMPKESKAAELAAQFTLKIWDLANRAKAFNKKQRRMLQSFVEEGLRNIFNLLPFDRIPSDIKDLHKEIFGEGDDDAFREDLSSLEKIFEENGARDIDLSDINPTDTFEEMLKKVLESLEDSALNSDPQPAPKKKSKRELLKEEKARDLEALQNKGLNSIYKRLAKELHPDLEQDAAKRTEKEALMKRLTVAYEHQDLISLLTLESEWLGGIDIASETFSEESFKAYNSLLKDQIEDLKMELSMIFLHPRYREISRYTQKFPEKPLQAMREALQRCDSIIDNYNIRLKDISGRNPILELKMILTSLESFDQDEDMILHEMMLDEFTS